MMSAQAKGETCPLKPRSQVIAKKRNDASVMAVTKRLAGIEDNSFLDEQGECHAGNHVALRDPRS
jgi:hypothetical protein